MLLEFSATLQTCTSCHAVYKQQVVDEPNVAEADVFRVAGARSALSLAVAVSPSGRATASSCCRAERAGAVR